MKKLKRSKKEKLICTCNYEELKKIMGSENGITHYRWCPMRKEFDKELQKE